MAIAAMLIPFPLEALSFVLSTLAIWVSLPVVAVLLLDSMGGGLASAAASLVIVGTASRLLAGRFAWYLGLPPGISHCLTSLNLAGPLYVMVRLWRGKTLVAGEILWAWLGSAWLTLLVTPTFYRMHGGGFGMLETMAQCARLTLALMMGLIVYVRRPIRPDSPWAHYVGWGLAECDFLVMGWYASPGR